MGIDEAVFEIRDEACAFAHGGPARVGLRHRDNDGGAGVFIDCTGQIRLCAVRKAKCIRCLGRRRRHGVEGLFERPRKEGCDTRIDRQIWSYIFEERIG